MAMVVCVAIGAFGFQRYQTSTCPVVSQTGQQLSEQDQQELDKLRLLKSSAVSSIVLFGEVKSISGNTITLSFGDADVSSVIEPSAEIHFVTTKGAKAGESTLAEFADIKITDNVQVETTLSSENRLIGHSVIIAK